MAKLDFSNVKLTGSIQFNVGDGGSVLFEKDGELRFEGNVHESAKILFREASKFYKDYIEERVKNANDSKQ